MRRIIASFAALAMALGLSFMLTGPAQSAGDTNGFSATSAGSVSATVARKARRVTIKFTATNGGHAFRLGGRVTPCSHRAPVHLQHKWHKSGHWKNFKKKRTNARGGYRFKHLKTTGFFRTTAPARGKCKFGHSKWIKVIKR